MIQDKPQIEKRDNALLVRAPAKINLSLLIAGKRDDGYHELETVMAKINLYDEILIEPNPQIGLALVCQGPHPVPEGRDNLVYRAAELFLAAYNKKPNLKITLTKNMPAGSGLGSGSSDAAAILIGLSRFLNLKTDKTVLYQLAAKLGSDVAFFLNGPLAWCTGRGENVTPIKTVFPFRVLLMMPGISVSTKMVYEHYRHDRETYESLSAQITGHVRRGRIDLIMRECPNMLAKSCYSLRSDLADLRDRIESIGIRPLNLSGSGSAMFYIPDKDRNSEISRMARILADETGCMSVQVGNNPW